MVHFHIFNSINNSINRKKQNLNKHIAENLSKIGEHDKSRVANLRAFIQSKKASTEPFTIALHTSMKDIAEILLIIPTNKAAGADNISAKMLRCAGAEIIHPLCRLVNCTITMKFVPSICRTTLHNGDVVTDMNNYRMVSVLPVLSKNIEKHMHVASNNYLCANNLLYKCQSDSG